MSDVVDILMAEFAACERGDHDFRTWHGPGRICYNCFEGEPGRRAIGNLRLETAELDEVPPRPTKGLIETFLTWYNKRGQS